MADEGVPGVSAEEPMPEGPRAFSVARLVLAIAGMSFLWPCLGSSATMHFRSAMVGSASLVTPEWHAVLMGALYICAIAGCLAMRGRAGRAFCTQGSARTTLALGVAGLLGHLMLVATPLLGADAAIVTGITVAGFVLSVAFIVGHILAWGALLAAMPCGQTVFSVVASNALSFACQLACDVLAGETLLPYLVVCPVFSAVLWVAAAREEPAAIYAAGAGRADGPQNRLFAGSVAAAEPRMPLCGAIAGLPWKFIVPTVMLIYFEQVFSSLLFQRYASWPRDNITVTLAVGCAIWLVASACMVRHAAAETAGARAVVPVRRTVRLVEASRRRWDARLLVMLACLVVVYLAALLAVVLLPLSDSPVVERLLVAAGSAPRVLLWLALAVAAAHGGTTFTVGCLTYVLFVLAIPVSRLVSIALVRMDGAALAYLTSPSFVIAASSTLLFIVAAVFMVAEALGARRALEAAVVADLAEKGGGDMAGTAASIDAAGEGPAADDIAAAGLVAQRVGPGEPTAPAHAFFAREYGLSARETDVLGLIVRGYSAKRIGERLCISESTVVSHTTHIYRKAGVNSKQELIALVEA